jgi:hypothetical protein
MATESVPMLIALDGTELARTPDAPFSMQELAAMMLAHDRQHCDEIVALVAAAA